MWRKFKDTTPEGWIQLYETEESQGSFNIGNYIKVKEDAAETRKYFMDNIKKICTYQKIIMIKSDKYPQISWESINEKIVKITKGLEKHKQILRSKVEIAFISATAGDNTRGLKSSMQRSELLDFLTRLAKTMVYHLYSVSTKDPISVHLPEFFATYIDPIVEPSTLYPYREIIRKSKRLNELLFDNNKGLVMIYEQIKKIQALGDRFVGRCSMLACEVYFKRFSKDLNITKYMLHESFIFSMMTIKNEHKDLNKYCHLEFVEFQEMVCRVAMSGLNH